MRISWVNGTESNRVGTEQRDCGVVIGRGGKKASWGDGNVLYPDLDGIYTGVYMWGKYYTAHIKMCCPSLYINFTSTIKENNSNGRTEGKGLSLVPTNLEAGTSSSKKA